jgi:hypothetical protein
MENVYKNPHDLEVVPLELNSKLEWRRTIGSSAITRERLSLKTGSSVMITTLVAAEDSKYNLLIDPRFSSRSIALEPGGWLIDQDATTRQWDNKPAGMKPESFLETSEVPKESVAIPPTNFGWQRGAFMVKDGNPVLLLNDRQSLSGHFDVIGLIDNKWGSTRVEFKQGMVAKEHGLPLGKMQVGFSLPLILEEGKVIPQMNIWQNGDPRAIADPRNFVDLSGGKSVPPEFWLLARKFMPDRPSAARRVTQEGRAAVIRAPDVQKEDAIRFSEIIKSCKLEHIWQIVQGQGEGVRVVIRAILPPNRIPVIGIGFTNDRKLIVTAIDGRQRDSVGSTIEELAQIMKDRGAVYAGLGSAGGDVAVVAKTEKGTEILNSPANKESSTRLVPSVLVIH